MFPEVQLFLSLVIIIIMMMILNIIKYLKVLDVSWTELCLLKYIM